MTKRTTDTKAETLRQRGCLHPHPDKVADELFTSNAFFDPRDLLQIKYEMLRRVRLDGDTISQTAARFGLSRPVFYQAQAAYAEGGLAALLPKKPGPRRAHKLSEAVIETLRELRHQAPHANATTLAELLRVRVGVSVHPRSIERARVRPEKNSGDNRGVTTLCSGAHGSLRGVATGCVDAAAVDPPTRFDGTAAVRSGRLDGTVVEDRGADTHRVGCASQVPRAA